MPKNQHDYAVEPSIASYVIEWTGINAASLFMEWKMFPETRRIQIAGFKSATCRMSEIRHAKLVDLANRITRQIEIVTGHRPPVEIR